MAAIDKLYVHTFQEYEEVKLWAMVYYPKLLYYFYNISLTYKQYHENRRTWVVNTIGGYARNYARLGKFNSEEEAIQNLIKHYKDAADYDCPYKQAEEEALDDIADHSLTEDEVKERYVFPIMNTPFKVDRKLKWICPVPCVREYLHKQCGVNSKWEWLYKIFWRGKKYF